MSKEDVKQKKLLTAKGWQIGHFWLHTTCPLEANHLIKCSLLIDPHCVSLHNQCKKLKCDRKVGAVSSDPHQISSKKAVKSTVSNGASTDDNETTVSE